MFTEIFWGFQWFKNHKAGGQGAQPPDAVGLIDKRVSYLKHYNSSYSVRVYGKELTTPGDSSRERNSKAFY